jgi:hypothetical protein
MHRKRNVPFPDQKTFEIFVSYVLTGIPLFTLRQLQDFKQPLITIGVGAYSSAVNFFEAAEVHGDRLTKLFPGIEEVPPGSILVEVGTWESDDVFNASWRGAVQGIAA